LAEIFPQLHQQGVIFIIHFYVGRERGLEQVFPAVIEQGPGQSQPFAHAAGIGVYHERRFASGVQDDAVCGLRAHALIGKKLRAEFWRA